LLLPVVVVVDQAQAAAAALVALEPLVNYLFCLLLIL
jgi:hypothetical protein